MFNQNKKDLILPIALGDLRLKLEKSDIRNEVKMEIWKAALRELKRKKNRLDLVGKKVLLYYKFGPSKKKKRHNYLVQMGDNLINDLYEWETIGISAKKWGVNEDIRAAHKYQIKGIFWNDNDCSGRMVHPNNV
jgi:hypothetical protein